MKINRKSFHTKNRVTRGSYLYIVFILAVLTTAFLLIANLSGVVMWAEERNAENEAAEVFKEKPAEKVVSKSHEKPLEDARIIILGRRKAPLTKNLKTQLEFLKRDYGIAESVTELKAMGNTDAKLWIVTEDTFLDREFQWIANQVWKGRNVFFARLPERRLLKKRVVRNLLGIRQMEEKEEFEDVRTSKELLLGTIAESKDVKITAWNLRLEQKTQVFASAIVEDVKNEDQPPLFWRYIQSEKAGRVYVYNGDLGETPLGYAMVSMILGDLYEYYIYPVINAFCVMADGMPYTENWESEYLERLYYRDALGMQRDLFFPELKRCMELYEMPVTCFSPDYEKLWETKDKELIYYLDELRVKRNEIGIRTEEGETRLSENQAVKVVDWKNGFSFVEKETGDIQLPVILNSITDYESSKLYMDGSLRGMGLLTVMIDLNEILEETIKDGEDVSWVEYCKTLESILGTYQQNYKWLDKVTAGEAAQRVRNLLAIETEYIKEEHGFRIEIENFKEETSFLLRTSVPVHEVQGGTAEFIGDHFYLIRAQEETVHIIWK